MNRARPMAARLTMHNASQKGYSEDWYEFKTCASIIHRLQFSVHLRAL